jgi:hypothetical protein
MIPKSVIKRYLNRKLDNHDWLKDVSEKELGRTLLELDPPPKLPKEFGFHQKVGFLLGVMYKQFCYWYDMGCTDCETEYLSPTGWRRMDDYNGGMVAQYHPDKGTAEFIQPERYVAKPCKEMITFKTRFGIDQKLSPDHKVLYDNYGVVKTTSAKLVAKENSDLGSGWRGRFYTTFKLTTQNKIPLSHAQLRIMVAFVADGSFWGKRKGCIRVKKERKKIRIRELLNKAKISFEEREWESAPDYSVFVFTPPHISKTFDQFYWQADAEQLNVIANELFNWDGYTSKNEKGTDLFYTTVKENADFAQYALVSSGRTTSLRYQDRKEENRLYILNARKSNTPIGFGRKNTSNNPVGRENTTDGKMYCFEVPSGFLVFRRNGCVFMSGNTGKTLMILALLSYFVSTGLLKKRALVLLPTEEGLHSWAEQITDWKIPLDYVILTGSTEAKWKLLEKSTAKIVLVTYNGFYHMVSIEVKTGKKRVLKPYKKMIKRIAQLMGAVVFDESTKASNTEALTYRTLRSATRLLPIRFDLAGRPLGGDPIVLWAQYNLVDDGETLGETLGLFQEVFFNKTKNQWGGDYSFDYSFRESMRPELGRIMRHRGLFYDESECLDLPPLMRVPVKVRFPLEIDVYYKELRKVLFSKTSSLREMENAYVRMRQLCSGFLGAKDDATGDKVEIDFGDDPKMDALLDRIDQMPRDRKATVFYEFTHSGRKLVKELKHLQPAWMWSGTKDIKGELDRFKYDPKCRVNVVNHKKGSYSLNFQHANYQHIYESPLSVIDRDQMEKRCRRQGQQFRVYLYDYLVRGSVEEDILANHAMGREFFHALRLGPSGQGQP